MKPTPPDHPESFTTGSIRVAARSRAIRRPGQHLTALPLPGGDGRGEGESQAHFCFHLLHRHVRNAFALGVTLTLVASAYADDPSPVAKAALPVAELKRESAVDFEKEILPSLRNNCLACHNTTKAKAGLNLETPQHMLKGGDSGPGVVPGKSAESLVFKAAAHLDPEMIMPPKDNKANASNLKPNELALLKLWIEQGAKGEVHASTTVNWLENPPVLDPILSLDVTTDGQFAACSRGSRVDVYHVPSGRRIARLTDSRLDAFGLTNAAHRDLVNAVAFHPDGSLLATAGYRDVKLWRRSGNRQERTFTNAGSLFTVSPDRKWLASTSASSNSDHRIQLTDLDSDSLVRTLPGHSNSVTALAFSPNQRHLASISSDQTVRVWTVADGTLAAETATPAALRAVTWLTDGATLVFAGDDGVIRVAALTNLSAPKELKNHQGAVSALAAAPSGNTLVSAGADGLARLWDLTTGKVRLHLTQQVAIAAVAVRPDGKRIATAGTNAVVRLWNAESGALIAELKGDRYAEERSAERERALVIAKADGAFHKKAVETAEAELKKAEARVAKATETNTVTEKVFLEKEKATKAAADAKGAAGKALTDLLAEIQRVTESYEKAAQASKEATALAADASTKATETQLAADRAAQAKADAERIATDSASVASRTKATVANADAAKDTARRIADESSAVAEKSRAFADAVAADANMKLQFANEARVAAKKAIEEVATKAFAAGQLKPVYDKTLAEAPEKRKQATNLVDSTAKAFAEAEKELQRAGTRKSITGHELELATAAGLRASNTVATTKATFNAAVAAEKEVVASLELARQQATAAAAHPTHALTFSPDGRTLATLAADGHVLTWSGDTGAAFDVLPRRPAQPAPAAKPAEGRSTGLVFLGRDRLLAPASTDRQAVTWNLNPTWTLERTIGTGDAESLFADRVNAVRFSPDGRIVATGGGEPTRSGEVKLFNVADGQPVRSFSDVHSDAVLSIDFSSDGKHLASSSADRFVKVVDLATGKVVKAFEGHTSYVLGVAWKRDSRTLASAGADKVIKVWDFVTGDRRKNIEGADKDVTGIAFVGVSDQMIATSGDSQVRLLKESGEKVRSFEGAADFMNSTAATPDGKIVIAGGQDGRLHIWNGADGKKMASFAPGE